MFLVCQIQMTIIQIIIQIQIHRAQNRIFAKHRMAGTGFAMKQVNVFQEVECQWEDVTQVRHLELGLDHQVKQRQMSVVCSK